MLRRFAAEAARDEARAIAGDIKRDLIIAACPLIQPPRASP